MTHPVRRRLGAVVAGAALTEEAHLLVAHAFLATCAAQPRRQARVALAGQFGQFPARHAMQHPHRGAETLGDARGVQVGEVAHGVEAQTSTSGGEFLVTERRQGLGSDETPSSGPRGTTTSWRAASSAQKSPSATPSATSRPSTSRTL